MTGEAERARELRHEIIMATGDLSPAEDTLTVAIGMIMAGEVIVGALHHELAKKDQEIKDLRREMALKEGMRDG